MMPQRRWCQMKRDDADGDDAFVSENVLENEEEDEVLEDGGVLGLLAQIYGTSANLNLKGRGRGAGGRI